MAVQNMKINCYNSEGHISVDCCNNICGVAIAKVA